MNAFASQRMRLNAILEAAAMRPANDNAPSATKVQVMARRADVKPSADYRKLSARLAKRQMVGNPRADNDNQGWPLAEQLRRDGNEVLLAVAERYRAIYDAATFEPRLVGKHPDEQWSPEQRHGLSKRGRIHQKGAKSGKRAMPADDGCYKAVAVDETVAQNIIKDGPVTFPRRPKTPVMGKWKGDEALIAAIDAKPLLARLHVALGPLKEPFEDAVVGSATLTEIGRSGGIGQHAAGAGKYAVMLGLAAVQEELRRVDSVGAA